MAPKIVCIQSTEILLVNHTQEAEVAAFVARYRSNAPLPPVVVVTYQGQHLAVTGSHRLTALEELVNDSQIAPTVVWSKHILLVDGDALLARGEEARKAVEWLRAECHNPVEYSGLDGAEAALRYQEVCQTLSSLSSDPRVKAALHRDASGEA